MIKHITFKRSAWVRLVAIALWAMTLVTAHAYDYMDSNGIAYNINNTRNTASVTFKTASYNSYSGTVVIPETISTGGKSYRVIEVGDNAFRDCTGLAEVTLCNNISIIGQRAFLGCSGLKSITLPKYIISVGDYAFADCSLLQQVMMNNKSPITLGTGVFMRCTSLTSVEWLTYATLEGKGGVEELGTSAFAGCSSLQQVLLPGNIKFLGNSIFDGCSSMQSLTMMSIKPIAVNGDPFSLNTQQVTIYVPCGIVAGDVAASYSAAPGWRDYNIVELEYSFIDHNKLTYRQLSNSTVALTGCQNAATSIDVRRSIIDNDGETCEVVAIADAAFKNSQVRTLNTSNATRLQTIGKEAFAECSQLKNVTLIEGITTLGEKVFKNCGELTTIKLPSTLRTVSLEALASCTALTHVELQHGLQAIDSLAFASCTSLKSINLPRSLATVKPRAFAGCTKLKAFSVDPQSSNFAAPDGVLIELASSFDYPKEELGKMIKVVAYPMGKMDSHFYCPYDIVEIAPYAFENITSLTYMALPPTLTHFGTKCLVGTNLERINYRATEPTNINPTAFSDINTSTILLQVPVRAAEAYRNANVWNSFNNIEERYNIISTQEFAFDWDSNGEALIVDVLTNAVHNGTLDMPEGITLSGVFYPAASLKNTATASVASMVTTLNLNGDYLANIDTSDGINPLATLSALQNITLSETNKWFALDNGILTSANGARLYYYLRSKTDASLTLDSRVDTIMPQAFANNAYLQQLVSNSKLHEIGIRAFENCSKLSRVDNAVTVTTIKNRAFKNCPITTFNGGVKLVEIEEKAFEYCSALNYFPFSHSKIKSIGDMAFKGCRSLKCIVFNLATNTFGDNVFEDCTSLENVYFINEVNSFGQDVFKRCSALSNMWLRNDTPPVIDHTTFEGNNLQAHALWVPAGAVNAYRAHPVWGRFGTINGSEYINNGGDVNGDGVVNAVDVTMLYNIILGIGSTDVNANSTGHCDVNHDGVINASDVTMVYNYILYDIELNSTYKFVNQENKHVKQTISMGASHEIVTAHDMRTKQDVREGFTIVTDNPQVLNVTSVVQNGIQRYELVPVSKGYATLVFIVNSDGINYYIELPITVVQ